MCHRKAPLLDAYPAVRRPISDRKPYHSPQHICAAACWLLLLPSPSHSRKLGSLFVSLSPWRCRATPARRGVLSGQHRSGGHSWRRMNSRCVASCCCPPPSSSPSVSRRAMVGLHPPAPRRLSDSRSQSEMKRLDRSCVSAMCGLSVHVSG